MANDGAKGPSKSDRIVSIIVAALLGLGGLLLFWSEGLEIVRDYRIKENTERVQDARLSEGGCRARFILTWCTVTFTNGRGGEPIFKETTIYVGRDAPYNVELRQERGNPSVMTTDMALSALTNRLILLLGIFAALGWGIYYMLAIAPQRFAASS